MFVLENRGRVWVLEIKCFGMAVRVRVLENNGLGIRFKYGVGKSMFGNEEWYNGEGSTSNHSPHNGGPQMPNFHLEPTDVTTLSFRSTS